jgi:response regulator RpfG family c-di-GMP phosphodiesterase
MVGPPLGTVLIVEDEEELRFILTAHLRAAGFEVLEAADGAAAIDLTVQRRPDLIILDIGLPVLDGIAVTRTLKADPRTSSIPVIMLTARSGTANIVQGLEAGAQEYLPKPFDVAELLARVRTVHRLAATTRDLDRLNTSLETEVDVKTRRLQVLYEYMRDLNHANSRDRILDLLIECVEQATAAGRISLFLADPKGELLVCERAVGMDVSRIDPIRIRDYEGITGQVIRSGKTLAARTYGTGNNTARHYGHAVFLSTPLISTSLATKDGVIGVLNVTEKMDDAPFADEEIECIRSIADAAAIALANVDRQSRLKESVRVLLQTVGHLAEYRDEETTLHLTRVTRMARILAEALQREGPYATDVTDEYVEMLVQAAPMHDIGKVGIPDEILAKPDKLTDEEFQIMKAHTDIGRRVLSRAMDASGRVPILEMCVDIAHCHHERYDGTGYPRRLAGADIPLAARIISLVDAYDAMTSRRRYKEARSHEEAADVIRREAGGHFDPVLVDAFSRCSDRFNEVRARYEEHAAAVGAVMA